MKLSQLKEQIRNVIRERFISESSHKLGSEQYTKKQLSPTEIHSLAMEYLNTSVNKMYGSGKKMDSLINVANDLARLTGTTQQSHVKRGNPALLLQILKNNLVDKNEYIKLYRELIKKQESVIKTLKNADPASRMVGGAAARQAYKDMKGEFEESVNEAITNPKKTNPSDLAKTVMGWFDFYTDYIDDGGQRRRALKSNDDVLVWFGSHPKDIKEKAYKIMLSQAKGEKGQIERTFGKHLKESVNEAKTYKKGDKLKIKLPNGKKFDVVFVDYSGTRGIAFGKFKVDGEVATKPFSLSSIVESVIREDIKKDIDTFIDKLNKQFPDQEYTISSGGGKYVRINHKNRKFGGESAWGFISLVDNPTKGFKKGDLLKAAGYNTPAKHARGNILNGDAKYDKYSPTYLKEEINESTEPQVISQMRDIVKKKQYQDVKDPSSGKKMKVDMQTANTVLKIYDGLSNANKQTMVKMGLPKMIDVSNKIISKYR
jgi:hypothetical protein